jgi:hypothetical protein
MPKMNEIYSPKRLNDLVDDVRTGPAHEVETLLKNDGMKIIDHCIRHPEKLDAKGRDGFTVADTIVFYAPAEVVIRLLNAAKTDNAVRSALVKRHKLKVMDSKKGVEVETLAFTISTLCNSHTCPAIAAYYKAVMDEIALQSMRR